MLVSKPFFPIDLNRSNKVKIVGYTRPSLSSDTMVADKVWKVKRRVKLAAMREEKYYLRN